MRRCAICRTTRANGPREQVVNGVYFLAPDGRLTRVVADLRQPNGLVGTADGKVLYVTGPDQGKTFAYDIQPDGGLTNARLFCATGSDGNTLDEHGNVFVTGKGVGVFNKTGVLVEKIAVPEGWTVNVCFGGQETTTLFITASKGFYAVKMKVKGAAGQ